MKLSKSIILSAVVFLSATLVNAEKPLKKEIEAVPGEYVIRLNNHIKVNKEMSQLLSTALGSFVKSTIPSLNIAVIKRPVFETAQSVINILSKNKLVATVEPNFIYHATKTPNDPMLNQLWGMSNVGQADSKGQIGIPGIDIDAEKAWDIETGSKKMIIAVIDTGVDFNHPDLKDNLWTNEAEANGKPGIDDDNNGVIDDIHGYNAIDGSGNALDDQGHGSHCSGTIGAKGNDGNGIVGVNWDTQIMAVKFLSADGRGNLEDAIKAIDYATKMGAKVMSNSWVGGGFSQTLLDAIERSNKAGAIFIAAAGNDSSDNDQSASYPASYNVKNIISVAAIDNKGELAKFSNYGKKKVHLAAPGVNIYSSTGGKYDSWSGTSMATPHVSGVAALVWSHEPTLTAIELKQRLISTTKLLPALTGKTKSGGMVNAFNALTNAVNPPQPLDMNDPENWVLTQPLNIASASPYLVNTKQTFDVSVPGAKEFSLYFEKFETEKNYDTLQVLDSKGNVIQTISGSMSDSFSTIIPGDTAKLIFTTDDSQVAAGWSITKAVYR